MATDLKKKKKKKKHLTRRPPLKQTVLGVFDFAEIIAWVLKIYK
jgi:hypothetical protein